MTKTNGLEFPWKKVTKGSRSITRRSKKPPVSTRTTAGESKPEKLGVSVLGQHLAERVEHVIPIKKRKFMVRSLPPSNRSSTQREGSKRRAHTNHAFYVSRLNRKLTDGRTSDILEEKPDCGGQYISGMDLLATVACSSAVSNDIAPAVESLPAKESVVQQQDASTLSTHVEGNDSSAGIVDVYQKYVVVDSSDQAAGQGKDGVVALQKSLVESLCNDLADELSEEQVRVTSGGIIAAAEQISIALSDETSTERPKANMEAGESENLALESGGAVMVSNKSLADDSSEKNNECIKEVRLHWDLNLSMDAWAQPCDAEGVASGRDVEGEITESIGPKESEAIDGSKDHMVGVIASDGHANSQSPSGPKSEAVARNGQEIQSGDDYQYEDGELREPYSWEEPEGETKEIEQVDHGSEPKYDNKMENYEKGILAKTNSGPVKSDAPRMGETNEGNDLEKHVVVCMNDSHLKNGFTSPSRFFASKPFKELPSHDAIQRRRPDSYEELSTGPDKFAGRDDRAGMRMRNRSRGRGYFGGWDSKRHSPNYKGGSYGFGGPRPKSMVDDPSMMNGFDQPGSGPGQDGHVRRKFSDGGYRGRSRRFPDGGDREFKGPHGDTNQYPGRMRRERGNTPVFRRLHYPQSESRSRSRSPVSWNGRNRSPHPPGGFRADEKMMERARLPSQKGFLADQEMGFMSPPGNRMSSPRFLEGRNNDAGEKYNSFKERKLRPGPRFDAGNSMRRVNPDNNHLRPFIRQRRFESAEENIGGNRFEMVQQRTRQSETTEDDGDDNQPFRLNGEQSVAVANNNNNNNNEELGISI